MIELIGIFDLEINLIKLLHYSQFLFLLWFVWLLLTLLLYKKDILPKLGFLINSFILAGIIIVIACFDILFILNIARILEYDILPILTVVIGVPSYHILLIGSFLANYDLFKLIYEIEW